MLRDRLERVRQRIQHACQRSGRQPSAITLIGVTKGVSPEAIREAVALGLTDLGENRVQEAREKRTALGWGLRAVGHGPEPRAPSPEPVRWHLIGHLQRNKAKPAVELFDLVHSADSVELIEDLERHAAARAKPIEVLIQVNVSGESTKFGCRPEEVSGMAEVAQRSTHVVLSGLMTIAPFSSDPEAARLCFRQLRQLRDQLQAQRLAPARPHARTPALKLSMGMSQDFEVAIEEGADFIRVGTAIFETGDQRPETRDRQ